MSFKVHKPRGAVLIVSLWVLAILTLLAVGTGHQMGLEVKVAGYHRDQLKALALARSGMNRALALLEQDETPQVDSLDEPWATGVDPEDGAELFREILLDEETGGTWSVQYTRPDPNDPEGPLQVEHALLDEERKINLNAADAALLERILGEVWIRLESPPEEVEPPEMAEAIQTWQGKPFDPIEELFFIRGMTDELFGELEAILTVYGDGKVNLNTATAEVLTFLGLSSALSGEIVATRQEKGPFEGEVRVDSLQTWLDRRDTETAEEFGRVVGQLTNRSENFRIGAVGSSGQGCPRRHIEAVVRMRLDSEGKREFLNDGFLAYREW